MATYPLRKGDTSGTLVLTLVNVVNGADVPVDLSLLNANDITFRFQLDPGGPVIEILASTIDDPDGVVALDWEDAPSVVDAPGCYATTVRVEFSDGTQKTYPAEDQEQVEVHVSDV